MEEPDKYDCMNTEEVICPYCGHENSESWEISENDATTYCGNCDKVIGIEQEVVRTFSSYKTCQPGDEHQFTDWEPYPCGPIKATRYCKLCRVHEYQREEK